ncbi:MAG TPA: nicotinate-nucleotide adenylyltransferase [Nitrospiria bacterium]|nr:nicotinate-nucleotide adenylyltransferase [Nitrospiria bacterium]
MNIGLLGGTFNPIHACHLTVADQVRQLMNLDRILFIPAGVPPFKAAALAPAADRLEMVKLAVEPHPWAEVSSIEIGRQGPSYTIDTVLALRREQPEDAYYFLIGADAFADIVGWRDYRRLLTMCEFVVINRPNRTFLSLRELPLLSHEEPGRLQALDRGDLTQERVSLTAGGRIWLVHLPPCPVSSTQVRAAIHEGRPVEALLPESVRSYILRQGLYR